MKTLLYVIMALLLVITTEAATIRGSIYALDLTIIKNAVVDISTTPHQRLIAKDGTYAFDVPKGMYSITARWEGQQNAILLSHDTLTVQEEGAYVFDLILLPNLEEDEEVLEDISLPGDEDILNGSQQQPWILYTAMIVVFLAAFFLFIKMMWKKSKAMPGPGNPKKQEITDAGNDNNNDNTPDYTSQSLQQALPVTQEESSASSDDGYGKRVIDLIRSNEGRVTQKDIRKQLPLSEAKVSLIITELEHSGKIKKIKKGRGNIIVLP